MRSRKESAEYLASVLPCNTCAPAREQTPKRILYDRLTIANDRIERYQVPCTMLIINFANLPSA